MARADLLPSATLRRAASVERGRIERARTRIEARRDQLQDELARLEAELAVLDERDRLLAALFGAPAEEARLAVGGTANATGGDGGSGRVLRGRELREAAARILYRNHGAGNDVYYRQWLDEVLDAGIDVVGKDPVAAFLTNVSRSPVTVRGDEPGSYRIDLATVETLRRELAETEAELADLVNVLARETNPSASLREHRTRLVAAVRRLEGQVAEADRVLGPPDGGAGCVPDGDAKGVVSRAA